MFNYEYWGFGSFSARMNMALEEFLLKRSVNGRAQFRFWDFSKDSVVLGYAQATDAVKRKDNSFDVVRRITGGSHVQTGKNIFCYTFAVPRDGSFKNFEDMRAYFAEIVANGLRDLGIENVVADNKASAILVDGKIIAAHSMIWGVDSALIHGLMHIDPYDVKKISSRVNLTERKIGRNVYTEYTALRNLPTISQLLSNVASNLNEERRSEILKNAIAESIIKNLTKNYDMQKITGSTVLDDKHKKTNWIENRKPPFTEEEIETIPGEELDGDLKKKLGYCLFLQVKNKEFKKMAETE